MNSTVLQYYLYKMSQFHKMSKKADLLRTDPSIMPLNGMLFNVN